MTAVNVVDLRAHDDLDALSEFELLDLYLRVRRMLASRLSRGDGSESMEMFFSRLAEVVEPPAPVVTVPKARISPREREVLHFLAQQKTNAEIAATLFISENTVKNHVSNILAKYEVSTRHGAVMAGIREGTLTVD
ncbi:regulatory protein, luxR family [Quadrisphaera granulorum]|uniref:Regulatory LuxR family protein n=1 Tax=Quadrisphaera granulorum TaxID=317664 RepID=A0A315ZTH0_9ACTN|nr:LuxR C-terminal-related transcriptional regulator [Quadrisphaera granulorum]PWJ48463.1 regulatory LuxR family protein [Quadrisphaera granulorum]SZE98422.1 regulatory protein, luxR family [Quadrisphaera granulorum]